MYLNIISHNPSKSSISASNVMNYLEKENRQQKIRNQELIAEGREDEVQEHDIEYFFNQDFDPKNVNDSNGLINEFEASAQLDSNRGAKSLKESNFYMLNISPSHKELKHIEKIAVKELESRGIFYEDCKKDPNALMFYNEQKENLIKLQLKLYTKDVMKEYASSMDREIYANQEALPNNSERKEMQSEIDEKYKDFLRSKGFPVEEEKEEPLMIKVDFSSSVELEEGRIFKISDGEDGDYKSMFIPNSKFTIIGDNKLEVDEEYYHNKLAIIEENIEYQREKISINELATNVKEHSNICFKDYSKEERICVNIGKVENEDAKIYFDKYDIEYKDTRAFINEIVYNKKVYEAKRSILSKKYKEVRNKIFNEYAKEKGYDFTKVTKNGKEVYKYPQKVPKGKELKKFDTEVSVRFNKFLESKGLVNPRKQFSIDDWETTEKVDCKILAETEKAYLVEFVNDKDLHKQYWVGKFSVKNKEALNVEDNKVQKVEILYDFHNNLIKKERYYKEGKPKEIKEYDEFQTIKEKDIKADCVEFTFFNKNLNKEFSFNIKKEDLGVKDGEYTISREDLKLKYEQHLINFCKNEALQKEYKAIVKKHEKDNGKKSQYAINKAIENEFKKMLIDKGILEQERNDRVKIDAKIEKENKGSSLISVKTENYDSEVKFWVNNKDFTNENGQLLFKNEQKINKLLNQAIARDKEQKEKVTISCNGYSEKELKDGDKLITFERIEKGLKEPIKVSFKLSELEKDGNEYKVEKYKLEFRLKKALEKGIKSEYGNVKEEIKNDVWKDKGFDPTKRKVEEKDLLYFAKVENERTYKGNDKSVIKNRETMKEIKELQASDDPNSAKKIEKLEKSLLRDKHTGEIIKEGVKKGGLNYHVHVVVSRHDRTSINPRDKVSMSPNSNQRNNSMPQGQKVGFNRDNFFEKTERIFDKKFEYDRSVENTYKHRNEKKKNLGKSTATVTNKAKGYLKAQVKREAMKQIGLDKVKQELNPIQQAKHQIAPIPIPTSLPKGVTDLAIKAIKIAKNMIIDKGIHY